ncbi:MAG TPA: hypothetical protein VFX45_00445 [Solirubrobacterales bacterium]|nr:hypothetical protein [Solirubrobacterales bacterium]
MSRFDFGTIICGGGPAGLGPVVAAGVTAQLRGLLAEGVRVIERTRRLGAGALGRYEIGSNSLGRAFLECLDGDDVGFLDAARRSEAAAELRRQQDRYPPLATIAAFMEQIGEAVRCLLDAEPGCEVSLGAEVDEVRLLPGGGAVVTSSHPAPGGRRRERSTARNVVVACGGARRRDPASLRLSPQIGLRRWSGKTVHAAALIDRDAPIRDDLCEAVQRQGLAVIVGSSHSAWSCASRIVSDPGLQARIGRPRVCMVERRPPRLAYMSVEEARADDYGFDPEADVCPLSGRVYRFSGLRGDAFQLARRTRFATGPVEGLSHLRVDETAAVGEALASAGLVISAVGFDACLPRLLDVDGKPLRLLRSGGGPVVSDRAELLDIERRPVPSLIAYGLGSGLRPSPQIGGEPSFRGRLDGVWLYQHDLGRIVLDRMLAPAAVPGGSFDGG